MRARGPPPILRRLSPLSLHPSSSRLPRTLVLAAIAVVLGTVLVPVARAHAEAGPAPITGFPVRAAFTPDDTFYWDQWGLTRIDAPLAWDVTLGDPSVIVAVVDTGVWWTHNDIQSNMWSNTDGTHGFDFVSGDSNPMDEDVAGGTFHGTGVAGVLAALTDNNYQIAGAAQVSVMALRALGSNGGGSSANTSQAIRWAADRGARIINLSLGTNDTFGGPTDMQLAIDYAWRRGALIIAAAGNSGQSTLDYPARLPNVVSVAALDESGSRASFSNYGSGLDVSAPGNRILTLSANNQFHYLSGTSVAVPFVAAEAALLLSVEPSLTNVELWNIINETSVPRGTRYNTDYGWGEINLWNAINALSRPFVSVNAYPKSVSRSSTFDITWSVLGPAGLQVTDTHVEWGTTPGSLGNDTPVLTGTTRESYTASGLTMPEGASSFQFRVVATVNGTRYESQELSIGVSNLPDFLFALYGFLTSNLLYLALFVLALAAIVAFIPRRRRTRARRIAYYYPQPLSPYAPMTPPPGPPPTTSPSPAPQGPPPSPPPLEFIRPAVPASPPATPPAQAAKRVCPRCSTLVSADSLFCFYCGEPLR